MSVSVTLDPTVSSLFTAIGLTDDDGQVVSQWFEDPIAAARSVLSNPVQRAALLELLEGLLPPASATPGWHPLLDEAMGNVYLTIEDDIVGVAGALSAQIDNGPTVRGSIRLPLVDVSGELRAIAGSPEGPIRIGLDVTFDDPAIPLSGASAFVSVDVANGASVVVQLAGLDLGSGPVDLEVDSRELGPDLVTAVRVLLSEALETVSGDPRLARLADHLIDLLGFGGDGIPPFPVEGMLDDPAVVRDWIVDIVDSPGSLKAWGTHLAGLIGADRPPTGDATAEVPLRAPLLAVGVVDLDLLLNPTDDGQYLEIGLAVGVHADVVALEATVTILSVPLHAGHVTRIVPRLAVLLRAPGTGDLADDLPTVHVGTIQAGLRLDDGQVQPWLALTDVTLDGVDHGSVDLTDADAIADVAASQLDHLLEQAFGDSDVARALLALTGLRAPATDPGSPLRLDLAAFGRNPTRALGDFHRAVLADPAHSWMPLFAELGALLDLTGTVEGTGTSVDPWRVPIAAAGPATLHLAAWDARDDQTPADARRLRLGLLAQAVVAPATTRLLSELVAIDLPGSGAGSVRLLGWQVLEVRAEPIGTHQAPMGLTIGAQALRAAASWRPGDPLTGILQVTDLVAETGTETFGPVTWSFPGATADVDLGDIGLSLLRLLLGEALHAWGGDASHTLGGLLGIHRGLPWLPADWPVLEAPDSGDLGDLLADPGAALRSYLHRLLTEQSQSGAPFADDALQLLAGLLRSMDAPTGTLSSLDVAIAGSGTHADPWAIPLPTDAGESAELLAWLDPAGPPAQWGSLLAARAASVLDGPQLASLLAEASRHDAALRDLLRGRDAELLGTSLSGLATWLGETDGLVPLASQLPTGSLWTAGTTVTAPHAQLPREPQAIAQVAAQLVAWAGATGVVVLVAPSFGDHTTWTELLDVVAPTRPAGTALNLRALPNPADVDLSQVTTHARHYTVDLLAGAGQSEEAQLKRAVDRVLEITGASKVTVVAHSTAGVTARVLAAALPSLVNGVITLGTPHGGSPLQALTDAGLAQAVRVAASVCGPIADTAVGASIAQLAAALDGADGPLGRVPSVGDFAGVPATLVDTVPGLAIGSVLGGDPIGLLAGAVVSGPGPARPAPTHLGLGFRMRLDLPAVAAGDLAVDAHARLDLARIRLVAGAPEPDRPATRAGVDVVATRPGGWLVGSDTVSAAPRVRWLQAGIDVRPGAPGAIVAEPTLSLHEASVGGAVATAMALDHGDLPAVLDALLGELDPAAPGTAARTVLDLFAAAGLVVDTADGVRAARLGISDLVRAPGQTLAARRTELIEALRAALDLPAGPLAVTLGSYPVELSLDLAAGGALRLRTTGDLGLPDPLTAGVDVRFAIGSMACTVVASVAAGPVVLACDATGVVTVTALPWLPTIALRPLDAPALGSALAAAAPRLAVSAAFTALVGDRLATSIGPIDAIIDDPVGWLRGNDVLGVDGHLDGGRVNDLLKDVADLLGLDADQGLGLPGGYLLAASGSDPARFTLSGTFGSATTATVGLDLTLEVHRDGRVTPAGTVVATIALPGDWGDISIAFSLDSSGVGLVITPENADPVRLLPTVDGLAILASGATQLLPRLLQQLVEWLRAQPGPHDLLDAVLALASALDVYADDASGFEEPARTARLRSMLQPGWLEDQVTDPGVVAGLLADLFDPATGITLPAGQTVSRVGDRVHWEMPVFAGCAVTVELGWSPGGVPTVLVGVTGLDTGPVVLETASLGYDGGLVGALLLRVDPGEELGFFTPEVEVGVSEVALSVRILPLGVAQQDDCVIVIVPTPSVTVTTEGALGIVTSWLVPLVTGFLLPVFEDLLDEELWSGGPTSLEVLVGAKLVTATPLGAAHPLPPLPEIALGALAALMDDATVHITDDLDVSAVSQGGRLGVRLLGHADIATDGLDLRLVFGDAVWLTDAEGVTVWLLREAPGSMPPFTIEPTLSIQGMGAYFSGPGDEPLVDGAVSIGSLGALVFLDADFMKSGAFDLTVTDVGGSIEAIDAQISLDSGDGDSFVAKILPKELQAPFSLAIAYRNDEVEIHGGTGDSQDGIELTFALDLNLFDVLFLRELYLAAFVEDGGVAALAAISGNAALGPLAVNVTRVGLQVTIDEHGAQFGFKPPDGFGLSLDASVVRAGGYLLVQGTRYVGALELSVFEKFSLSAIGIVTTRAADGSPGFSLLLLITVQLPVPIPIGYGFFFAGAGGLLGLNRAMDVDRIRDGLRAGTADSILFPTDIINRIDTIVRDLEESFPQDDGHFLIAPMVWIQWMNPALVTLKVGLIIEIAMPPRIAILGVLRLALPTPDQAVVDLKVAFLGSIDLGAKLLSFDAAIYDSFVGYGDFKLSLEGDIAIRVSWGDSPDLVASIGGFHPAYTPAAHLKLPVMRRLAVSLLKDNPRISLRLYMAVTSNTVQMGAQLEFYVGVAGFSISGDLGFDVLVQIVPFLLDAHMWARLAVTAGGTDICSINLDLRLTGPTPWIARGTASFKVLFLTVHVEVEATFGEEQHTSLPSAPILNRLIAELSDPKAWSAELSRDSSMLVTLLAPPPGVLVVDAGGLLTVVQNLIPLDTDIGLVGAVPPADIRRASISRMRFGVAAAASPVEHEDVLAAYAPSAFAGAPTADADRLRAPAFEQRPTGVRALSGHTLTSSFVLGHAVAYERIILDDPDVEPAEPESVTPPVDFGSLVPGGAVAGSPGSRLRRTNADRGTVLGARQGEQLFAVTARDDLTPLSALLTRSDAEALMAGLASSSGPLQLVPEVQCAD